MVIYYQDMETTTMTTATTKTLIAELSWIDRFVEKKSNIPILTTVRMKASGEFLKLEATDLETAGVTFCDVSGDANWSTCVPVKALLKYLAKVEEKELLITGDANGLTVEHGDNKVKIDANGSVESFPDLPAELVAAGTISDLETAIPQVAVAISTENSRFSLSAALLEVRKGQAVMVSCDGNRLSHVELKDSAFSDDMKVLVSSRALNELGRIVKGADVRVSTNEKFTSFAVGNRKIISRKPEGNFPDYERVMPRNYPSTVEVDKKPLTKLIERIRTMADERSRCARWEIAGSALTVSAEQQGSCKAQGSVKIEPTDVSWSTGLNCDYALDFMKLADDVQISVRDEHSAAQFKSGNWTYVVMPMRV